MLTRDQQYAISAHQCVEAIAEKYKNDEQSKRKYGSTAHKLPILIRTAGLAQALTFIETREKGNENPYQYFLRDLKQTIGKDGQDSLSKCACEVPLDEYMLLTQQVLHALLWYKRFAQSILDVDASATIDDSDRGLRRSRE